VVAVALEKFDKNKENKRKMLESTLLRRQNIDLLRR
jgi:hypothetical protein